ncbi:sodium-dependent transporter [Naegleria gruberi]|uniref:Sodium-dependent transporter n=1 Tax=Naegleria gruberi TaxID=5762 RepID=D2V3Q7_NAEGR|nr:sodium-dependent transporter [Naegleria gruberi]EFC48816.1 sodium-dependent transporter [Naegleria gruberi]|eukprot:XP_002681560.1 sodium-dependent transporter [Naegleria gruberi strain NEG-M]
MMNNNSGTSSPRVSSQSSSSPRILQSQQQQFSNTNNNSPSSPKLPSTLLIQQQQQSMSSSSGEDPPSKTLNNLNIINNNNMRRSLDNSQLIGNRIGVVNNSALKSIYSQHIHHYGVGAAPTTLSSLAFDKRGMIGEGEEQQGTHNHHPEELEETIMMEDVEREHQAGMMEEVKRDSSRRSSRNNLRGHHQQQQLNATRGLSHHRHHGHHHRKPNHKPKISHHIHRHSDLGPKVESEEQAFESEEGTTTEEESLSATSSMDYYADNVSETSSLDLASIANEKCFKFVDDGSNGLEDDKRQHFGSVISFLFAAIGSSVGLGDLIRFPYLVYTYGGGGFLIPYIFCLVVLGLPLTLLEFSLGVMSRRSSILSISKWNRRACGVGLAMTVFGSLLILSYYNVILSWTCVYFVNLFQAELPWIGKAEEFFNSVVLRKSTGPTTLISNYPSNFYGVDFVSMPILLGLLVVVFFNFLCVFKGVSSIKFVVFISVPLPICLLAIYLLRTILFEVGSSSGLYYFFKPDFSVLLKTEIWLAAAGQVFFSVGVGNGTNSTYSSYLSRKSNIIIASVVVVAANCFIAFLSGFTIFSILGVMAHDKFGENALADFDKLFTSDTVRSGLGLAFIVYFQAVSYLPVPHFSALLLIATIFSMGLDSAFACVECVTSALMDHFSMQWNLKVQRWKYVQKIYMQNFHNEHEMTEQAVDAQHEVPLEDTIDSSNVISSSPVAIKKETINLPPEKQDLLHEDNVPDMPFTYKMLTNRNVATFIVCLVGFILGLPFTLNNGYYLIRIVDHYISNYCLVLMGLAECIVVGYFAFGSKMFESQCSELEEKDIVNKINEALAANHEKWQEEMIQMIEPSEEGIVDMVLEGDTSVCARFTKRCKIMATHFVVFFKYLIHCPNLTHAFRKLKNNPKKYWKGAAFFSVERFKNHILAKKQKIIQKYATEENEDGEENIFTENTFVYKCTDLATQTVLWVWCFLVKYFAPLLLSAMLISTMITETIFRFPFSFNDDDSIVLGGVWFLVVYCV